MTTNGDGQRLRGMRSSIRRNMRKLRKSLHKPSDHLHVPSRSSTMKGSRVCFVWNLVL